MRPLPRTEQSLVLRTDFSDDAAWHALCAAIQHPNEDGFRAYVDCVSDPTWAGATAAQVAAEPGDRSFVFLADHVALTHPERPVLVVDLQEEPGRSFRVIPREMWGVENNLSLANMDFADFAENVDPDGVFRGF